MEQEWQKYKLKINNHLITVKVLINKVSFKPVLINTSYKYYYIVDKDFITELRFPRVKIPLEPIISFIKEKIKEPWIKITKITKFSIDICQMCHVRQGSEYHVTEHVTKHV